MSGNKIKVWKQLPERNQHKIIMSAGGVTVYENGFVKVAGFPLGTIGEDGVLTIHVQSRRLCANCERPSVDLQWLLDEARALVYGDEVVTDDEVK